MRLYGRVLELVGLLAGAAFGLAALATAVDVVLRNLAGSGVFALVDIIEYGLFVATFLAAPWVLHHNGHVQVDFLVNLMPPQGRRIAAIVADLAGVAVSGVLLWYGLQAMLQAKAGNNLVIKTMVFPEWWMLAVVPVAAALLMVEFLRRLSLRLRPAEGGDDGVA